MGTESHFRAPIGGSSTSSRVIGNMKNKAVIFVLSSLLLLAGQSVVADATPVRSDSATLDNIRSRLLSSQSELPIKRVSPSEFAGLYEVELTSGQKLYTGKTADFLVSGALYKVTNHGFMNLTELAQNEARKSAIAAVDDADMVVFSPKNPKKTITVFTDSDCGYCRKLHRDVPELNKMGIAVRYLAYPRAGVGSATYNNMVSAWCADDKLEAMNKLKSGKNIPTKTCENPIGEQYQLGRQLGVTGTPALVLEDGRLIPGYLVPEKMAIAVGLN